jgi:hypothetical protein
MKTYLFAACASLLLFVSAGCSPLKIYSNKGLSGKSGLKYYTVKPFLHVEREVETGRIVKATVIYLPDLANPQYMVIHDGLGSKKVNLKFTDGSINTFGYSSVGKAGESVEALAAMISKSADALTEINALKSLQAVKAPSNTVELYEIVFGTDKTTLREVTIGKE